MPASFQDMAPFQHGSTLYVIQVGGPWSLNPP